MNKYPEHEKMMAVKDDSQHLGSFLEWLFSNGNVLCRWHETRKMFYDTEDGDDGEMGVDYEIWPEGYYPVHLSIEKILAEYFDIDLDKIQEEKEEMYQELRSQNV